MDRQIAEVQALATKYSKAELGRMVSMGLLDPQKAMMAGMMIDRIQKQNAQPPQSTVAEDVLGLPGMAQRQQQQMQQPQPAGLETLPAGNIGEYAGGGIVAFADGGEADDYAYGGSVHFEKGGKVSRYDKFATPYDELITKSAEQYGINPIVYKRLLGTESNFKTDVPSYRGPEYGYGIAQIADIHGLTREQRADPNVAIPAGARIFKGFLDKADGNYEKALQMYKGAISPGGKSRMRGVIEGILEGVTGSSPAQAAEPAAAPVEETFSAFSRGMESTVKRLKAPFGEPSAYAAGLETYDKRLAEVNSRLGELGGTLGLRQQTPEQAAEFEQLMKDRQVLMNARNNLAQDIRKYGAIAPSKKPAATTTPEAPPEPAAPAAPKEGSAAAPTEEKPKDAFADIAKGLKADTIPVPKNKTLKQLAKEQEEADALMGVDKEIFNKIRQDYKKLPAKFEDRRNKAAGYALMMSGLGLFTSREGQEAEALGKYGTQALMGYMSSMDKLNENEDKLAEKLRDLDLAEQSYLRTKSEKALGEKRSLEREIRGAQLENAKLTTTVNLKAAEIAVDYLKINNPPEYQKLKRIAEDQRAAGNPNYTTLDALRDSYGVAKTGQVTRDQAYKAWSENLMLQGKYPDFEQYWAGYQRNAAAGGGGDIDKSNPLLR